MKKSIKRVTLVFVLFACGIFYYQDKQAKGLSILASQKYKEQKGEGTDQEQEANIGTTEEEQQGNGGSGIDYSYNTKTEDEGLASNSNNVGASSEVTTTSKEPISVTPSSNNDLAMNGVEGLDTRAGGPNNGDGVGDNGGDGNSDYKSFDKSAIPQAATGTGVIGSSVASAGATGAASSPASVRAPSVTIVTTPANPGGGGGSATDPYVPIDDYYGLIFLITTSTVIGIFSLRKVKSI